MRVRSIAAGLSVCAVTAFALCAGALLPARETPAFAATDVPTAASADGSYFRTQQGEDGWFYCYGSPEKYGLMTFSGGYWVGPESIQYVQRDLLSPGPNTGTLAMKIAESDGTISVRGTIYHAYPDGDGVYGAVWKNGEALYEHTFSGVDEQTVECAEVPVKKGDRICYYMTNGGHFNNAWDGLRFNLTLEYVSRTGEPAEEFAAYLTGLSDDYTEIVGVQHAPQGAYPLHFSQPKEEGSLMWLLYVGIGVIGAALIAGTVVVLCRRKKS